MTAAVLQAAALTALLAGIQARYEQTQDLQAEFVQLTSFQGFTTTLASKGRFALKKPGRFRWDYTEPHHQQIVVNGDAVLYYVPEHQQVMKTTLKQEADTQVPVRLLAGTSRLARDFNIQAVSGLPHRLRLRPRDQTPMQFEIDVDPITSYITRITLESPNGNTATFRFTHLRPNLGLTDALFSFTVPPGVEVIDMPDVQRP